MCNKARDMATALRVFSSLRSCSGEAAFCVRSEATRDNSVRIPHLASDVLLLGLP